MTDATRQLADMLLAARANMTSGRVGAVPDALKPTTMDVTTRTLLQITVEEAALADEITSVLMGDDVDLRKAFITTNARDVRNLDF